MARPSCSPPPPIPVDVLDGLARSLATGHHDADTGALVVRARSVPERSVEIAVGTLEPGVHPVDALLGTTVLPPWSASGVVASGRAHHIDAPRSPRRPVTMAVLVSREGHVAHHVVGLDPTPPSPDPPEGRVLDVLRRSLGLPTDPPPLPAAEWWRARWLDGIVSAAALGPDAARDHPEAIGALPVPLVAALRTDPILHSVEGWELLRRLVADPDPPHDPGWACARDEMGAHLDAADAAWMDAGCFSRWMLDALPSVEELLVLVDGLLAPEAGRQVRRVLGAPLEAPSPSG